MEASARVFVEDTFGPEESAAAGALVPSGLSAEDTDVINALTSLGYSVLEAQSALRAVPKDLQALDQRILAALRSLGSG